MSRNRREGWYMGCCKGTHVRYQMSEKPLKLMKEYVTNISDMRRGLQAWRRVQSISNT